MLRHNGHQPLLQGDPASPIPFIPHMLDADYVEGLIQLHCMWLVGCKGGWVGAGAKVGGLVGCKGGLDWTGLGNDANMKWSCCF